MAEKLRDVDALARLEMAREKASIAGRKPALPSALEQAAQVWKAEQEQRERVLFQPGAEASAVLLRRVALQEARPNGRRTDGEVAWRPLRWGGENQPGRVALNAALVSRIAQHLRATEWARARRMRPGARFAPNLESWAESWRRNQRSETRVMCR